MITIILIYLLIGWVAGFVLTIYYSFHSDWDEMAISIIQTILYWPWFLVVTIHRFSRPIVKKLKNMRNNYERKHYSFLQRFRQRP